MRLNELFNIKLKPLYTRLRKITKMIKNSEARQKELSDNLELLNPFLYGYINIENIRNMDTSRITDLLREYHYIDDNNIEQELNIIKVLLKGIYDNNLKTSLSESQKEVLISYIDSVVKLVSELNEKISVKNEEFKELKEEEDRLELDILKIEILQDKILSKEDQSLLDMEDLETVKLISEDSSVDANIRKEILIKFIEYNNDRKLGKSKDKKVNIEDVIKLFNEFNKNLLPEIKKYSNEVQTHANIENIRSILSFMQREGFIDNFNKADLLVICLFGTLDSVQDGYDEVKRKEDNSIYYATPSVWVNNTQNKITKKKKYKGQENKSEKDISLHSIAHMISKEELDENIEYLTNQGFVFDINDVGIRKILILPNYKLKEAVNALKTYGILDEDNIKDYKLWMLTISQTVEKLDRFIELGLLAGHNTNGEFSNYLRKYPSKLHNFKYALYMLLYKTKQTHSIESYYDLIASPRKGQLAGGLTDGKLGDELDSLSKIEEFKEKNFVNYEDIINNYSLYEHKIDSSYNLEIDNNIFNFDEIKELEENYTVEDNPFVYVFDGLVISRLKVLRNYSLIHDGTKESLMTSIVKGSFLTPESIQKIANSIGFVLGGNDGISKKL